MDYNVLWSLRLGYSSREADKIRNIGLQKFLENSFTAPYDNSEPDFMKDQPRSLKELKELRKKFKALPTDEARNALLRDLRKTNELRGWWLEKMLASEYPLREKMVGFWQNHLVVTSNKVKVNHWLFTYNTMLREHAFGNYRDLTKKMLRSNAMVHFLDNSDNRVGKLNENLSRELLELFTLGIGNYTEDDIKAGAKGLAGLTVGAEAAVYRPRLEDNEPFTYLGKHGNFKADALVDRIFEHPQAPYLLTRKLLKWLVCDEPTEAQVRDYGDFFRKADYEIRPLLQHIAKTETLRSAVSYRIKDPLTFALQLYHELGISRPNLELTNLFLKKQGMELLNPPNVKGWDGGRAWLNSQTLLQRYNVANFLCAGKDLKGKVFASDETGGISSRLQWRKADNKAVIRELADRLLCFADADQLKAFEEMIPYDFDPNSPGADNLVLRLFNDMIKTPEFQLV